MIESAESEFNGGSLSPSVSICAAVGIMKLVSVPIFGSRGVRVVYD